MLDTTVFDAVSAAPGAILDRRAYHADAAGVRADDRVGGECWKLERPQTFRENGDPAWEAFSAHDWDLVVDLFEAERTGLRHQVDRYRRQGLGFRKLRIAELPPEPYLRWEMLSHRVFVESGFEIGVLEAGRVRVFERRQPLPEVVVYGDRVVYQIRYDALARPAGAKRIDDPVLAADVAAQISHLHASSEPLLDFFAREIAPTLPERIRSRMPAPAASRP